MPPHTTLRYTYTYTYTGTYTTLHYATPQHHTPRHTTPCHTTEGEPSSIVLVLVFVLVLSIV